MKNRSVGICLSYINTGVNMVCGLFLSSFFLKRLGLTDYGIYLTISSFANCLVLLEFGIGTVMTRNISVCRATRNEKSKIDKQVSTLWCVTNALACIILLGGGALYCVSGMIYKNSMTAEQVVYAKKILIFVVVFLVASFYIQTLNGIILAFENYVYASLQGIAKTVLRTILMVTMIHFYQYALLIGIIDMVLSLVQLIVSFLYCRVGLKVKFACSLFDKHILMQSLPLCVAIFLQAIVNQANSNVDKFLIGILLTPESVTIYSIALYVYSTFSSLLTIPISLYAPDVAKKVARGDSLNELTAKLIPVCRLIAIIGGMILFGFIAVGRQFVCIVYGKSSICAWTVAVILMVPTYINMTNGILVNLLDVLNKRMVRSTTLMVTTAANFGLTLVFLKWWGIIGAAVATAICTLLGQDIIMNIYYQKALKIPVLYLFKHAYKGILEYLILGMMVVLGISEAIENELLSFCLGVVVFMGLFFVFFCTIGSTADEKTKLRNFLVRRSDNGQL